MFQLICSFSVKLKFIENLTKYSAYFELQSIGVYEKLLNMTNNIKTEISNSKKIYFDNLAKQLSDPKPKNESEGLLGHP